MIAAPTQRSPPNAADSPTGGSPADLNLDSAIETGASAMPKQKTHKGVRKRFRLTATGKVKHRRAGTSHLQVRLTAKRRRNLRGTGVLASVDTPKIVAALGKYSY